MTIINSSQIVDMTTAIERIPFRPGLLGSLNLYKTTTVRSDAITFDVRDNALSVLDDHLRNTAQKNASEDTPYDIHTLALPHYPISKTIGRERLAGVKAFGKEGEAIIAQAVAEELEKQAERHDLHLEYLQAAMTLSGVVVTNKFGTYDMATEFGITRPTQALTPATLLADMRAAMAKSKDGLKTGGRVGGYVALVGNDLFESILTSEDVKTAYQYSQASGNPLQNSLGEVANGYTIFRFGNIDFILYDDQFTKANGTVVSVLAPEAGVLIPRTTLGTAFYGPASTLSGLGSVGSKRFARQFRDPKDRFVEVESESSVLVVNEQFGATVALSIGV